MKNYEVMMPSFNIRDSLFLVQYFLLPSKYFHDLLNGPVNLWIPSIEFIFKSIDYFNIGLNT